jgi:hypothetical protein
MSTENSTEDANASGQQQRLLCVVVELQHKTYKDGKTATRSGEKALIINGDWVEATTRKISSDTPSPSDLRNDLKTFASVGEVEALLRRWEGHPWYHKHNGNYEVFEVEANYKKVPDGYRLKDA